MSSKHTQMLHRVSCILNEVEVRIIAEQFDLTSYSLSFLLEAEKWLPSHIDSAEELQKRLEDQVSQGPGEDQSHHYSTLLKTISGI